MKRLKSFVKNHLCCSIFICFFAWASYDIFLLKAITLARCYMWEGKNLETYMTPQEWRIKTGYNESLKNSQWLSYTEFEDSITKHIYIDEKEYYLNSRNNQYPYLGLYIYIKHGYFGYKISLLYDTKLKKIISKYYRVSGVIKDRFFGTGLVEDCSEKDSNDFYRIPESYLNN